LKTTIVIPARWNSSRFKGKPLAKINGITVLERVWRKANLSKIAKKIVVATDHKKIENFCKQKKIQVLMTSNKNKTGTDRVYEVSTKINSDIYVNLQGDEPLIDPKSIDKVILCLEKNVKKKFEVSTGFSKLKSQQNNNEKSCVFLVKSVSNQAIFFSRSKIPFNINNIKVQRYRHIGLYAYTKQSLKKFHQYKVGPLEISEKLEQMRFLENGERIICTHLSENNLAVDYPSDIKKIENFLKKK